MKDYYKECIEEAFHATGIRATEKQIEDVAEWVMSAVEHEGQATGCEFIPDPIAADNEELKKKLERERNKIICLKCNGKGVITDAFLGRSSTSDCFKCGGSGYLYD